MLRLGGSSTASVWRSILACLALALTVPALWSQSAAPRLAAAEGPAWASLTAVQRQALAPLERDWTSIDASRKAKWLDVAARFPSMSSEEQQRIQERMRAWVMMSPQQRGQARLTFQESRQISPQDRQQRWDAYQNLAPDQRAALALGSHAEGPPAMDRDAQAGRAKKNLVSPPSPDQARPRVVAPTVVQPQAGATTSLVNKLAPPPVHQQPGMPKIAATPNFVDRTTLLPKRGPQGAESRGIANAASAPAPRGP